MLIYAGQFVLSRWSMRRTLSPWDLAALRFTVAGLLSLPTVSYTHLTLPTIYSV